ncbi:MAG: BrnT family toxin [Syntrophales bacterium LBB04]|nr:BrnT family toxin [Syntrophales bacterium LBB04]
MKIVDFEWDEGNVLHLELGHGIRPEEAEQVFAVEPIFRRTKRGHYTAMGPTVESRYLVIIFGSKKGSVARVITGWDMDRTEIRYWTNHRGR